VAIRPHSSLARSAARGTAVTIVGQSLRIGTQFASIAILARLLDPVDYGYLAMVLSVIGVAELLRDFGLSAAAVQSRSLTQGQQSNLFWLNTLIGAAASLLVLACSPLIGWLYGEPELTRITMWLSPSSSIIRSSPNATAGDPSDPLPVRCEPSFLRYAWTVSSR